ncbi:MAG TPA: amidohydrolase family protein [Actinomycetota bacterium]|nr:amidohydrolase family protein [Actinomycetota bacterium]
MTDLLLAGGTVVTSLDPPEVRSADVLVRGSRIAEVAAADAPDAERIDCSGCLVIPGNVCAHHHLYSALARGMPYRLEPPEDFIQVLQRIWWRLDRALDEDAVWLSAWSGGADALLAGTTTIVDHHASPNAIAGSLDQIADALGGLGARSVLCYEVTDRDGPERAAAGLEENLRFCKGGFPLAMGMVGAHASFTLSDETLGACVEEASDADVGVHVHVAEDAADERDAMARFDRRVVGRLAEAGALGPRSLLAHCVHVDEGEIATIRQTGAWVAHNPRSNMNNRVGRAPVADLGPNVALGTDGIDGDLFAESRTAFWRAREADATVTAGWILERMAASARFAAAVFEEPLLGTLRPRAPADLVVLEYDPPTPVDGDNLAGHWAFGLDARHVRDVVVNGEVVVHDRRLTRAAEAELRGRSREAAEGLWRRIDATPIHPFEPEGGR